MKLKDFGLFVLLLIGYSSIIVYIDSEDSKAQLEVLKKFEVRADSLHKVNLKFEKIILKASIAVGTFDIVSRAKLRDLDKRLKRLEK